MAVSINVKNFGAIGDGIADDSAAIQKALDHGADIVEIPEGMYRITATLLVSSHTRIEAHPQARIFSCGDTPKKQGDFLLSNRNLADGNCNIVLHGGIWDGNHQGKYNTKNPDLFAPNAWSGAVLNFFNVSDLVLEDLIVADSVTFFVRLGKIENFTIRNIGFRGEPSGFNQDGLHFSGFVRNGLIENITALTPMQTTDDMLALNADDSLERLENRDLLRGPIENLIFRNIYAESCYTAIRMLSVTAPIRNIRFENIRVGCLKFAINMDAARYCRTPLFNEADHHDGVGEISNIVIDNMQVWRVGEFTGPLICDESNSENVIIKDFKRLIEKDEQPAAPTIQTANIPDRSKQAFARAMQEFLI